MSPPRVTADERLRRLLAVVPWVAARDGPSVEEVCARFGYTEGELAEDLDLLFLCGVYPFSPDTMIEADLTEGRVWIRYAEYFAKPLRLTAAEALALVAAGSALQAVPGFDPEGPLARGLAKLAAVLGVDPEDTVDVDLGAAPPETLATLQQALAARRQLEISYYSWGRDEWTRRVVDPISVYSTASVEGAWYLDAYCHLVEGERTFRLDRIRDVAMLDTTFEPRGADTAPRWSRGDPGDPVVVLELAPSARWVTEYYDLSEPPQDLPDGRVRVALRIGERAVLQRLLLNLGPDAAVVEGDASAAREAAAKVLARYRG